MKKLLFFLLTLSLIFNLYGSTKDYTSWWRFNYGDYTRTEGKNDPRVKKAFDVFNQVKNAADKTAVRSSRLFIINTRLSPYAMALPDGGIIINPVILDICYTNSNKEVGDSRFAFIIGHQLAHLANEDLLDRHVFAHLRKYGDKKAQKELAGYFIPNRIEKYSEYKKRVLLADYKGALYAAMAGYDMNKLFLKKDNFFTHWARQTGISLYYDEAPTHPSLNKRLEFIRAQLQGLANQVELFKAGVLFFQMGNYHDGAAAFREFSKVYPSSEVFNNIGVCYLNLALHRLHITFAEDYYRFRLSTTIDSTTTSEALQEGDERAYLRNRAYPVQKVLDNIWRYSLNIALKQLNMKLFQYNHPIKISPTVYYSYTVGTTHSRVKGDYLNDEVISRNLNEAVEYFRFAAARDKFDSTCRYNLAAALILKKEYAKAKAQCDDILKIDPQNVKTLNNKAITFYYYGQEEGLETTHKAIQLLKKVNQLEPDNYEVLYNLASLQQNMKRMAGAKSYWEKYLKLPNIPKDNYYNHICRMLGKKEPPPPIQAAQLPPLPKEVQLGEESASLLEKWKGEAINEYKFGSDESRNDSWSVTLQVITQKNLRILILDGLIELVEQELIHPKKSVQLLEKFGPPQKIIHHTTGNFYIYDKKGFSLKEVDGMICSYIWFEKSF
jgi:tetratricopeptide (TPR) repeat protein